MPNSTHKTILDAVRTAIVADLGASGIDGIEAADVKVVWVPAPKQALDQGVITKFPAILISPYGIEQMPPNAGTVGADDYDYPCHVCIVNAADMSLTERLDLYLYWRERIRNLFQNQRLSGVSGVWRTYIVPGPISDNQASENTAFWASMLTVRAVSREQR